MEQQNTSTESATAARSMTPKMINNSSSLAKASSEILKYTLLALEKQSRLATVTHNIQYTSALVYTIQY